MRVLWAMLLTLIVSVSSGAVVSAEESVAGLRASLGEARAVYETEPERAREIAGDAFLRFESSGLDKSLASRDLAAYKTLESTWLKLVSAMRAHAPQGEIDALEARLSGQLAAAEPQAERTSAGAVFANSLVIILREGFEAILILSAVAAALRASGHGGGRALGSGAGAALVASLVLAVAANAFGGFGRGGEALEGVTCLVAVVVLFFTSYWLISRVEGRRWQQFIRRSIERAAAEDRRGGLFLLAFLVVFREGFETVLFYQALGVEAQSVPNGAATLAAGFIVGLALLAILYGGITWFGLRLPIRQFFAVTGALLYLLAIKFAGVGIRELQEAGWLTPAPIGWLPEVAWLRDWLGVLPDLQVLIAQGALIAAVVVGIAFSRLRGAGELSDAARRAA